MAVCSEVDHGRPGKARYSQVQPGTVLKRPIMCYIYEKQALRGYQIWYWEVCLGHQLGHHLGHQLGHHLGHVWGIIWGMTIIDNNPQCYVHLWCHFSETNIYMLALISFTFNSNTPLRSYGKKHTFPDLFGTLPWSIDVYEGIAMSCALHATVRVQATIQTIMLWSWSLSSGL